MTTGSVIRGENERDERSGSQAGLKKKCISHDIHNCGFLAFFWSFFFFFFFTSSPKLSTQRTLGGKGLMFAAGGTAGS